nr:MAG TPA: hypothetical protein [Caudoviricetes sp.]
MTSPATACKWVFCTPDGCWEFTKRIPRDLIQWINQKLSCVTTYTVELVRQVLSGSGLHQQILLETTGSFFATVEEEQCHE